MAKIEGLEKLESLVGPISTSRMVNGLSYDFVGFSEVQRIDIRRQQPDASSAEIELTVRNQAKLPVEITVLFDNAMDLRIGSKSGIWYQIIGLAIIDVSGYQWDRVNWELEDYESDSMKFRAENVILKRAEIIEKIKT